MGEAQPQLDAELSRALSRRIFASEKARAGILAGVAFTLAAVYAGTNWLLHADGRELLPAYRWILLILIGFAAYEGLLRYVSGRFIARNRDLPLLGRYANAFVETSIPTLLILAGSAEMPFAEAITGISTQLYFLFIILVVLRLDFRLSLFTGVVAAAEYSFLAFWNWDALLAANAELPRSAMMQYAFRPILLLISGAAAALVSVQIKAGVTKAVRTAQERKKIFEEFGQYVSPAVVDQLLAQPAGARAEEKEVCILVLDIRDFTTFSETAQPQEVVTYLNNLWGFMVGIVNRHSGIVNKFLGDGFMAVFGAPIADGDHCGNAVRAAKEILAEVQSRMAAGTIPETRVGMGLHAGSALVGVIGSAERKEFTLIGDVVNVAFRIEQLNKKFGSSLLISEQVRSALPLEAHRIMETVHVKGRNEPVQVAQLN